MSNDPLRVRLSLGNHPSVEVSGQTIAVMRRDQLGEYLRGGEELKRRALKSLGANKCDGVHLSDDDGLPGHLRGTFAKYNWRPARLIHKAERGEIISVSSEPAIIATQPNHNPSSIPSIAHAEYPSNDSKLS